MNKCFKRMFVATVLMVALVDFGFAQNARFFDGEGFLDNDAIAFHIQKEADRIIAGGNFMAPAEAARQLEESRGRRVKIEKVPVNTEVLDSESVAKKLGESNLIVADGYLCGHCEHTHVNAASGYVIDASGIFVTNYHVVENYASGHHNGQEKLSMQIMTSDGKVYPVTAVLAASKETDLAILKAEIGADRLKPLPLGDIPRVGADVFVLSHPNMMFYYFSRGVVARNYMRPVSRDNRTKYPETEITADYAAGSSGAAVVDDKCNLVATVATTQSIYYNPAKKTDLQMVVKGTKPVVSLRELLVVE